ncbi:protein transport protein Sec16B [Nerophis lumbriciformis]|uniref:protein transport protein Sec16B n=1 Tax=Nerophis lumbriciformis TaxID=546530 RepID=UPI002AE05CC4|nr:protein transport protein Sec16B [Nerophis lumbriciformis]
MERRRHRVRHEQGPPGPEHHYWTQNYSGPVQNLETRLDQQQPPSRRGYDHQAYAPWDYGATYAYHDHYNADHHASWWPQPHHGRTSNSYSHSKRASCDLRDQAERASKDSLQASTASGFWCSSNELGQYSNELGQYSNDPGQYSNDPGQYSNELGQYSNDPGQYSNDPGQYSNELGQYSNDPGQYINGGQQVDSGPSRSAAPLKFSSPHAVASFGPAGQLVRVTPGRWAQDHLSHVEIHSLEVILRESQEQQEMRNFPGPLTREGLHKVDAIDFARQRALACSKDDDVQDRSSAALLWNILVLLCRQNGQIVGSDVAELLMAGSRSDGSVAPADVALIDFSEDNVAQAPPSLGDDLLTGSWSAAMSKKSLHGYTQLLLAGRKKEALDSAMGGGLWGHALFLASKMDARSYTTVLDRFTGQVSAGDPLQTLFQLLSGRIPAVATCFGGLNRANWRPHLAVMLSNETGDPTLRRRAVVAMGDTLASRGLLHAAHVCYLTSGVPFGAFGETTARMVLLGRSHKDTFRRFASDAAIRRTEIYEYCRTLGAKHFSIPSFQVFKFLYATRLLDCGLACLAFHYCEVVGRSLLTQPGGFHVLTEELIKLAERLTHIEGPISAEPRWLTELRSRLHRLLKEGSDRTEVQHPQAEEHVSKFSEPDTSAGAEPPHGSRTTGGHALGLKSSWNVEGAQGWTQTPHTCPASWDPQNTLGAASWDPGVDRITYPASWDPQNTLGAGVTCPASWDPGVDRITCPASWDPQNTLGAGVTCPASWDPQNTLGAGVDRISPSLSGPSLSAQSVPSGATQVSNASSANERTDQSTKSGWFRGWFKSKTPDIQD